MTTAPASDPPAAAPPDADVHELHQLGYAQLLLRDIGGFASFAISFSVISIITGFAGLYGYGLKMSGPFGLVAGWPLVCIFALAMAASMAEIASSIPTAGAMYHWATFIGGRGWGWFVGWANVVGMYAIVAGIDYSMAQFVAPLLGVPTTWGPLLGLTALLLISHGLFCHFGIRLSARLNDFSAWYHIGLVTVIVGAVLVLGRPAGWSRLLSTRQAASSGFGIAGPYGWLFLVGLLPGGWIFTGYDASAHISEETHLPRVNAPWGIFMAVAVSALAGWLMIVALTLGIHDLDACLTAATRPDNPVDPFLYALNDIFGGAAGIVAWLVAACMWFCGLSALVSAGRTVYAFARDRGMPGWRLWGTVSPHWRTPVWGTWQVVAVALLLVMGLTWKLPDLSPITATAAISLYLAYGLPVALRLWARARGTWRAEFDGPWSLGRLSGPVNAMSVAWMVFICVIFMAPPNQLVGPLFGVLVGALLICWLVLGERGRFVGPQRVGTEEQLYEMEHVVEEQSYWHAEEAG